MRELWGLANGERILHTAHRTTTSSSASRRLAALLDGAGYTEIARAQKGEKYSRHYTYTKQLGLERIILLGGRRRLLRLSHPFLQGRAGRGL